MKSSWDGTSSTHAGPAIYLEAVSKRFKLYESATHRLRDAILRQNSHRDHWALRDISLTIQAGESVAVLGANGAGKSTLLRIIASTTAPTTGAVRIAGRLSALLELGVGFQPEWTGRQNAEFYVRLIGVPGRAVKACLREIESFADIGPYFDQPLRTYSSGMFLRVAFAAAASVNPDVLIVDEALAVGDTQFQFKCFQRIRDFQKRGATVLLVTHRLELVPQFCSRALVLHNGALAFDGPALDAVNCYVSLLFSGTARSPRVPIANTTVNFATSEPQSGGGLARIVEVSAQTGKAQAATVFASGDKASFVVRIRCSADIERPLFGFSLNTVEGVCIYGATNEMLGVTLPPARGGEILSIQVDCALKLPAGSVFAAFYFSNFAGGVLTLLDSKAPALELTITRAASLLGIADLDAQMKELARGQPT